MFSQITGEFDQIEFAEYAAKRIRETVSGSKKISIRPNSAGFKNLARKNNEPVITNGEIFYLLPTAINSYNYITCQISRPVNTSQIEEPLLRKSVRLKISAPAESEQKISQIMLSYGGYGIHTNDSKSNNQSGNHI